MELLLSLVVKIIITILVLGFMRVLVRLFDALIWKPERLRSKLKKQGIQGPPPSFLIGNTRDIMKIRFKNSKLPPKQEGHQQLITHNSSSAVFGFLEEWRKQYGPTFFFSLGNVPVLHTTNPDVLKELHTYTSYDLSRSSLQQNNSFIGKGILGVVGEEWARQRKIIAPELFLEKVKRMTKIMVESALIVVKSLNDKIDNSEGGVAELTIDDYLRSYSEDVLSRACFESKSNYEKGEQLFMKVKSNYEKGEQLFMKVKAIKDIMGKNLFLQWIPGFRYLPIKSNREVWRLEKEFCALMLDMIKERKGAPENTEKDLFQVILEAAESSDLGQGEKYRFILDNCKNMYFAGSDTTAASASWTLMLLALYPEWQDKVRAEVLEICGGKVPDADMLRKMNLLTMVIYESLRLYSPSNILAREAVEDLKLGGVDVPKGVNIWIVVGMFHQDPNFWGPDFDKFNPERFSNGLSGACKPPQVFIPFAFGPHTCLGQHFAISSLKILLTQILSTFVFTLSPKYRHSPIMNFVIEPEHGVDLLVRRL